MKIRDHHQHLGLALGRSARGLCLSDHPPAFRPAAEEWFELFGATYLALWWIEEGAFPDAAEGRRRLAHLDRFGPTPFAFTFKRRFPAAPAMPVADISEDRLAPEPYRSCG